MKDIFWIVFLIIVVEYIYIIPKSHKHYRKELKMSATSEPESFVVIPSPSPASAPAPESSSSDTSFEELPGLGQDGEQTESRPEADGDDCNDSVRQVLDDVEAQIEKLRDSVSRLAEDKRGLLDVLEGISQSVPTTPLSEVEREEVVLEVGRLRGRVEEVRCELETRRTETQQQSLHAVEAEMEALVSLVETEPDTTRSSSTCRGYLAACGASGGVQDGPAITCHKFEKILLGCAVEDQKRIRRRLGDLLTQIEILADNKPSTE